MRIICTFYELFYSRKVELHKKYSDSVFNEKKENQINYQRLKREEVVNKNLAKEHELMQLKLTQKQHQMWAFAGTIFSLIVLAIALFRNNQLKSKLNNKLRKKNQEIEDKNKQLSDLNTTKDILFRVIAHDLKHPMALMVSYTEMMDEDFDDFRGDELRNFIRKLNQSSNEGLMLLENLMSWAQSQTGAISVQPEKFDIYNALSENIGLVSHQAGSKNIQINNEVGDQPLVWGDKNMTATVLRNLLTNAVKFTPEKGIITISSQQKEKMLEISVQDTGVGISDEDLPRLFNLHQKLSKEGTNKEKGTGLGLIICKDFVEKQGGTLQVESRHGKGSVFRFTIPLA
jgi:signal transduction histidine kinase